MKANHIIILGLIILLFISFFSTNVPFVKDFFEKQDSVRIYREKVSFMEKERVRMSVYLLELQEKHLERTKAYQGIIDSLREDRDKIMSQYQKLKIDRQALSDDELITEIKRRVPNGSGEGIYKLSKGGIVYVLNVIDERDMYRAAYENTQQEISYLQKINTEDGILIDQLKESYNLLDEQHKELLNDMNNGLNKYQKLSEDYTILEIKNKNKLKTILILTGVIVVETTILILSN